MTDLEDRLRRLARRIDDDAQAFERLRVSHTRRAQRRRVLAGALALAIAGAGSSLTYAAFRARTVHAPADVSPSPTAIAMTDVAVVVCDGITTTIQAGWVAARPDGVHVEVVNASDRTLAFAASDTDEFHDVPPGTSSFVESFFLDPGAHFVACGRSGHLPGGFTQQIVVADPNEVWVPYELVCSGTEQWGRQVTSEGDADPIDLARTVLGDHVQPGDRLELAGYPDSPTRRVVLLIRAGRAVAQAWMEGSDRAWFATNINGCR